MDRTQILATFRSLATSQGFYGRLLNDIENAEESARENFLTYLELQNFKDSVDLVMFMES